MQFPVFDGKLMDRCERVLEITGLLSRTSEIINADVPTSNWSRNQYHIRECLLKRLRALGPILKIRKWMMSQWGEATYREANNSEGISPSRLTPARQSNSTSLSDPASVLAEARMTLQWPCRLDPCNRNFRWRKAPGTPALSTVGLCSRSVNKNIIFN